MPTLQRLIRVAIGDLLISDVRIGFNLDLPADSSQVKGYVQIYNLAPEREEQIYERGENIVIEAGYSGALAQLHHGSVQRVQRYREGLAANRPN